MKNYGYKKPIILPTDYRLGDKKIPDEIIFPDGHGWGEYFSADELQWRHWFDTNNCTAWGLIHALEMFLGKRFADKTNWSERALGIIANTDPDDGGNDPNVVAEAARHNGLMPEAQLPFSPDITNVQEYYSPKPLPQNLLDEMKRFLDAYIYRHDWVVSGETATPEQLIEGLKRAPLSIGVYAWEDRNGKYFRDGEDCHWVCLYDYIPNEYWLIRDSYEPFVKKLEWDFGFSYVMRHHVIPRPPPPPVIIGNPTSEATPEQISLVADWIQKVRAFIAQFFS